jgi:Ca2+-binding EF-hand superfamily protein
MQPRNEIESYTSSTVITSKFTEKEKNALKELFSKAFIESKNDYGLDFNSFKLITDLKNEKICKKLFSIFDVNGDGGISFDDFETTLSIIARGMPNEKAKRRFIIFPFY